MLLGSIEKTLARIVATGSGFTTIFIVSGSVTDPVNVTKLLTLGVVSSMAMSFLVLGGVTNFFREFRVLWTFCGLFLAGALLSVLMSASPLSQGVYGAYGRNNGLLAYLFLVGLLLSTLALSKRDSISRIILWLIIAGLVNVAYCLWVIVFGDFIGWSNPYGNILGTLGNPNFIGSFLGIFLAAYLGYGLGKDTPIWFKYSMLVVIPVTAFEIYDSSAIQGRVVGLAGVAIVGFFVLRSKFSLTVTGIYSGLVGLAGVFAVLGALQVGPLTSFIYKTSVSLRGQYWLAGWNTGEQSPLTGVGMDAFGDWYRRSRDAHALELPGVNTVVNAAHNVPLDMFAFGGWPLFITYLLIMGSGGWALLKTISRVKNYDPILTVLTTAWFGYQLQSIISINQIGLAIWGWVLTGAAVAYERITRLEANGPNPTMETNRTLNRKKKAESQQMKAVLFSSSFGIVGLLIVLPPFTADSQWRKAQVALSVEALEASMKVSYFNPQNSMKYMTNIQTLEQSNFPDLAHKYALNAVKWNPEAFELWKVLYLVANSTAEEKQLALDNMKRLDPLNPDVTSRS
jgi:O-antigen ligase